MSDQPSAAAAWSAQPGPAAPSTDPGAPSADPGAPSADPGAPSADPGAPSANPYPPVAASGASLADDRPEIVAGAAFAAGFVFAMILRRVAG